MIQRFALIIEDDSKLGSIYSFVLQQAGYRTELIQDGQQALAYLADASPDLILLDIHLPYVSGLELLQTIRTRPHLASVPVIIQTADIYAAKTLVDPLTHVLIKTMGMSPLRKLIAELQPGEGSAPSAPLE